MRSWQVRGPEGTLLRLRSEVDSGVGGSRGRGWDRTEGVGEEDVRKGSRRGFRGLGTTESETKIP